MKIQPLKLSAEKARSELKLFSILGLVFAVIGLVIFWFLGIVGIVFGVRALLLSYNKNIVANKDLFGYRAMGVGAIVIGIFDLLGGLALSA